ncbi:MAG: hypothetical protein KatS3mg082_0014 [Nitrospiraceae bacterium]|nr:MAG: hypothetical protein KatS3mg082_0014 [Nitrospiraceae bacterium]
MKRITWNHDRGCGDDTGRWIRRGVLPVFVSGWLALLPPPVPASHQGHAGHTEEEAHEPAGPGYAIPGASFRVFFDAAESTPAGEELGQTYVEEAVQTVVEAFTVMMQHRTDYARFDEALKKKALDKVVVEPAVVNRDGKEFAFLVARTNNPGRVKLLISASFLREKGYLGHPDKLVPVLAREFQWVVSKAETAPKPKTVSVDRDLRHAPIRTDKEIREMSGEERERLLRQLFDTYLKTVDDYKSLQGQPFYEVGTTTLVPATHPDSTIKLYDIRVREALQKIVRDPYFAEHTPKAVRSLLNGKIWSVAFVKNRSAGLGDAHPGASGREGRAGGEQRTPDSTGCGVWSTPIGRRLRTTRFLRTRRACRWGRSRRISSPASSLSKFSTTSSRSPCGGHVVQDASTSPK